MKIPFLIFFPLYWTKKKSEQDGQDIRHKVPGKIRSPYGELQDAGMPRAPFYPAYPAMRASRMYPAHPVGFLPS